MPHAGRNQKWNFFGKIPADDGWRHQRTAGGELGLRHRQPEERAEEIRDGASRGVNTFVPTTWQ